MQKSEITMHRDQYCSTCKEYKVTCLTTATEVEKCILSWNLEIGAEELMQFQGEVI